MNITELSSRFTVRRLTDRDVESIYELCKENPLFYRYCPPFVTREKILEDQKALPPGTTPADKFYLGYFRGERLIAVMDLILHYPNSNTAFIGFFMMARPEQGRGTGSGIIDECARLIRRDGFRFIRLGFAEGNPQSEAFWKKNGFVKTGVIADHGSYRTVMMERTL